jgi:hypothetical protein
MYLLQKLYQNKDGELQKEALLCSTWQQVIQELQSKHFASECTFHLQHIGGSILVLDKDIVNTMSEAIDMKLLNCTVLTDQKKKNNTVRNSTQRTKIRATRCTVC